MHKRMVTYSHGGLMIVSMIFSNNGLMNCVVIF